MLMNKINDSGVSGIGLQIGILQKLQQLRFAKRDQHVCACPAVVDFRFHYVDAISTCWR